MSDADQSAPAAPDGAPRVPESYRPEPPGGQRPGLTPRPQPQPSSGTGWKWFIGIMVVMVLLAIGSCALVFTLIDADAPMTGSGDTIALIHVNGVIAGTGTALDGVVSPEVMISQLKAAEDDPNVKAILLRIDSPGGTVAASQEIATEVSRLEKPVVASIGDVGASGAYMVASQCDRIVAVRTSAVGSIGVITQIPNVAGLLDKLGIEFTVLTAGEYKDAGSPYRSLTATETELIQQEIDIAYDEFISIVAEGRDLPEDDVRELATGFAWSAIEAQKYGLVDDLGTYTDAVEIAAELGDVEGEPTVVSFDEYGYPDIFSLLLGVKDDLERLSGLAPDTGALGPAIPK